MPQKQLSFFSPLTSFGRSSSNVWMPKCSCELSIRTSAKNLQGSHSEGFLIRTESSLELFRHELRYMNFGMRLASKNRSPNLEKETFLRLARPLLFQNARNVNSWMGLAPTSLMNRSHWIVWFVRIVWFVQFVWFRSIQQQNDFNWRESDSDWMILANRRRSFWLTEYFEKFGWSLPASSHSKRVTSSHFELLIPGITELLIPSPSYQFTSTKSLIPSLLLITQSLILTQLIPSQKVWRGHPIPTEHVKRPGY